MILLGRKICLSINTSKMGYRSKLFALWAISIESLHWGCKMYSQKSWAASSPQKTLSLNPHVSVQGGALNLLFLPVFQQVGHRLPQTSHLDCGVKSSLMHFWHADCKTAKLTKCLYSPQFVHVLHFWQVWSFLEHFSHRRSLGKYPWSHSILSSWRVSKS